METKLKPKTLPVKEVTKSSPAVGTNLKAPNGTNGTTSSGIKYELMFTPSQIYTPPGVRIAKIRNR